MRDTKSSLHTPLVDFSPSPCGWMFGEISQATHAEACPYPPAT